MEALRYVRKIESEKIVISDLARFMGKEVEIIILPVRGNKSGNRDSSLKSSRKKQGKENITRMSEEENEALFRKSFGSWQDERSADEIIAEIRAARQSRDLDIAL